MQNNKYMEKPIFEHHENTASDLIKNDYLNEYLTFTSLLMEEGNKYKTKPIAPESFSGRYPDMKYNGFPFQISEIDKQRIEKLDKLSVVANRLLDEIPLNEKALMEVVIQVADICDRPDFANKFKDSR